MGPGDCHDQCAHWSRNDRKLEGEAAKQQFIALRRYEISPTALAVGDVLLGEVLDPSAPLQHGCADDAFQDLGELAQDVQRQDGKAGKPAQAVGQGDADHPHEAAVEQEGYKGLAAGAEGEIGGVGTGHEGHQHSHHQNQPGGQMPHLLGGVVNQGEGSGQGCLQRAEQQTRDHGDGDELSVGTANLLFRKGGSQHLPHEDAHGVAQGQNHHIGQIGHGAGNVHGGHHIQTAGGIALVQDGHARGPQEFIDEQGHTLYRDAGQQLSRNVGRAVHTPDEGIALRVQVGPARYQEKLHKPGDHRGQRRALHAHRRRAEVTEDQHIVKEEIHEHRRDAAHHGNHGLPGFPEGAGVSAAQGEGQKAPDGDAQVAEAVVHGARRGERIALSAQVQPDELPAAQQKDGDAQDGENQGDEQLEPDGVADAPVIPGAVKLGCEDARAGAGPEDAQIKDKRQPVDNGDAAHGNGAHPAHHNVVEQGYKVCNAVLDDDGDGNPQDTAVKRPVRIQ